MTDDTTTIQVRKDTRDRLWSLKTGPDDTYDDALRRVLSGTDLE